MVGKLHKSLYGLKQVSKQWNAKLTSSILQYGFKQSISNYSLFTMNTSNGEFVALLIYIDDILIASNSTQAVAAIKSHLNSQFKLKDLGTIKYFLGLEIARSPQGILICQRKYTLNLLEEYGLLGAKLISTSINYNVKLRRKSKEEEVTNLTRYKQLVGKLLYLTFTRLDISYAVQSLAQFMDKPTSEYHMAAHRMLKYLKRAPRQGILMKRNCNLRISTYCDNDWAGCLDTRRFVTSSCVFIGESLVSWKSEKQ
ncbi:Reverse transcriptase [Theobroma cacao]|nr:Reverse transcriptase [Theobroma cacao]